VTSVEASGWLGLLLGSAVLIQGIRLRAGLGGRNLARSYRDTSAPRTRRNAPFAGIPIGLGFVLTGLAAIKSGDLPPAAVAALAVPGLLSLLVGLAVLVSPPAWSKPRWLRQAEADAWRSYQPDPGRHGLVFSAILAISVFGAAAVIIATSFQPVEVVGPLLLGLGAALAFWGGRRRAGGP
jgi:hypothetical protein